MNTPFLIKKTPKTNTGGGTNDGGYIWVGSKKQH